MKRKKIKSPISSIINRKADPKRGTGKYYNERNLTSSQLKKRKKLNEIHLKMNII